MIFIETELKGAYIIEAELKHDIRGFNARAFCQNEFKERGLNPVIAQANIVFTRTRGSLRGMHFQYPPAAEQNGIAHRRLIIHLQSLFYSGPFP